MYSMYEYKYSIVDHVLSFHSHNQSWTSLNQINGIKH
jgi:hypothetical protein